MTISTFIRLEKENLWATQSNGRKKNLVGGQKVIKKALMLLLTKSSGRRGLWCCRRQEQRRKKYDSGDDADKTATQDHAEQLDDAYTTSTPACQRLISHDDDQSGDIRSSSQGRRYARCPQEPRDAASVRDNLLPPPPPPPSRGLLSAVPRREFIETSF